MKNLGPCYRHEREVCAKEGENIPTVEGRERGDVGVYTGVTEERIHLTLQVTSNGTSVLCKKEGWEKEDGARLSLPQ